MTVCNNILGYNFSVDYTCAAETSEAYSVIDHFYVSDVNSKYICSLDTIHVSGNLSDHMPLALTLDEGIIELCRVKKLNSCNDTVDKSESVCSPAFFW